MNLTELRQHADDESLPGYMRAQFAREIQALEHGQELAEKGYQILLKRRGMLTWRHFLYDCLRFVGMRDRLRCPRCQSVGTWKPRGGGWDGDKNPNRWLCKWCGLYVGPEGILEAHPDHVAKEWHTTRGPHPLPVPKKMVGKLDPWNG